MTSKILSDFQICINVALMIVLFAPNLGNKTNSMALISNMAIAAKTQINIFSPKFKGFYFCMKFVFRKLWGWFQIRQYFFQVPAQKHPNKAFLYLKLSILIFSLNVALRNAWGCWFQIWQYFFKIPSQKYPNEALLVLDLKISFSHQTRVFISSVTIVFSTFSLKIPKYKIFCEKSFCIFSVKLSVNLILFNYWPLNVVATIVFYLFRGL